MSIFDPILPLLDPIRPLRPDPIDDPEPGKSSSMAAIPTSPPVVAPTQAPTSRATTAPVVPTTTPPAATTPPPVATTAPTTPPVVASSSATTVAPVVPTTAPTSSVTTSAPPTSSAAPTSSIAATTSSPSAAATTSSAAPTTTIFQTVSRPSLNTSVVASSRTSASAASSTGEGKGGVGGSGLAIGALVGIIIGGIAAIALVAFLVTHSMRKKARSRRTANRSSMFEPWPAPAPVALEDEPYEKSRYDAPSQSYAMQDQSYDPYTNAQQQAYHNESQPLANYPGVGGNGQPGYPGGPDPSYNYAPEYGVGGEYPPQGQGYPPASSGEYGGAAYGGAGGGAGMAAAAGVGAGALAVGAMSGGGSHDGHSIVNPATGLADGSMVRVQVGFVRTLEDELAITPDQQLFLHNQYDDGWSLCEDQNQNRGVVPVSCLVPWTEQPSGDHLAPGSTMPRSNTAESLTGGTRRSSLYNAQTAGQQRMSQHGMY